METNSQVTVEEAPPSLYTGGCLYFILFAAAIYYKCENWVYAVTFAILLSGFLGNLCENKLTKCIGYLTALPICLVWIQLNKVIASRIVLKIQAGISETNVNGIVRKVVGKLLKTYVTSDKMLIFYAVTFIIGFIILSCVALKLSTVLPEKLKLPVLAHKIVVFCVNFLRLQLMAFVLCFLFRWGLEKLGLPGNYAYWILVLPWCFIFQAWKQAKENVNKLNEKDKSKDKSKDEGSIKSIEIPKLKLSDVAGMKDVKEEILHRMIMPLKNPAAAQKYGIKPGGGILLYGPPGTGKTYLAKAVAGELKIPFYAVTAADIFSKYVGESEKNVSELFATLRKHKLSVLFIDELEAVFRKRSDEIHETTRKIISVLLQELDGISSDNTGLLLIGATNAPHLIDEAFLRTGRFDVKIFVGLPDKDARKQIIESNFADVSLPIEDGLIDLLAECTENFSGADLKGFAQKVKQRAFANKAKAYTRELFQECLSGIYPSQNKDLMRNIREWENNNL